MTNLNAFISALVILGETELSARAYAEIIRGDVDNTHDLADDIAATIETANSTGKTVRQLVELNNFLRTLDTLGNLYAMIAEGTPRLIAA